MLRTSTVVIFASYFGSIYFIALSGESKPNRPGRPGHGGPDHGGPGSGGPGSGSTVSGSDINENLTKNLLMLICS